MSGSQRFQQQASFSVLVGSNNLTPSNLVVVNANSTLSFSHHLSTRVASNYSTISSSSSLKSFVHRDQMSCNQPFLRLFSKSSPGSGSTTNENADDDSSDTDPRVDQPAGTATVTFVETEEGILKSGDDIDGNGQKNSGGGKSIDDLPHPREHYTIPIVVKMPDMSDEDDENNTVEKWFKKKGDIVQHNDVLCDIGTPDFTFGMVTDDEEDAIMGELHVEEGTKVPDNEPICTIYHYDPSHDSSNEDEGKHKDPPK